jgi:predicted nucleic-acid-binding protein
VLLEVEWVLRFCYGLSGEAIAATLRKVIGLENVSVEHADEVFLALAWYEGGMDFADALHLASSGRAHGFATFDAQMVRTSKKLDTPEVLAI